MVGDHKLITETEWTYKFTSMYSLVLVYSFKSIYFKRFNRLNDEMIKLTRTDSQNSDFKELVEHLDIELKVRDGDDHGFYHQFNKIDKIKHTVVAYKDDMPVGCGAIKEFNGEIVEVKRMFVSANVRGIGIAVRILNELEEWANELNYSKCILETGFNQPEAIGLYRKCGYHQIKNYGQYQGVETSLCFEKLL